MLTAIALLSAAYPIKALALGHFSTWLPQNSTQGERMVLKPSPRYESIQHRMHQAIAKHRAWFNKYYEATNGELPYHPNLGVSKQEYEAINSVPAKSIVFRKLPSPDSRLVVSQTGSSLLVKATDQTILQEGVTFDEPKGSVAFSDGVTLDLPSYFNTHDSQNVFRSTVEGYTWQSEDAKTQSILDDRDLRQVQLVHFKGKSLCHLSVRIEKAIGGKIIKSGSTDIRYKCPK